MSNTLFVGGIDAANKAMQEINAALGAASSNLSVSGCAAFYDGNSQPEGALDDSMVTSVVPPLPTGAGPNSTNCVFWATKSNGDNAFVNAAAAYGAFKATGLPGYQSVVDAWQPAPAAPVTTNGGFTQ